MRYIVYAFATLAASTAFAVYPTMMQPESRYADSPRIDRLTVEATKLVCVENRCYDVNKLPARYRNLADQQRAL